MFGAFLLASLCLCAQPGRATTPASEPAPDALRLHAETWTTEQGLPGDTVKAILQTRDGYLWVATQGGLARFDGVRFAVFNQRTTRAFRNDECSVLYEGRDGALWVGTIGGGLIRHHEGRFTAFGRAEGLPSDVINGLYEDRSGRLWITSYERLTVMENGALRTFAPADGVTSVYALPFYEDDLGRVWIFNTRGLSVMNHGTLSFYQDGRLTTGEEAERLFPLAVPRPFCPFQGRDGTLWFHCFAADRFARLRGGRLETFDRGLGRESPSVIHEDAAGALWLGLSQGRLARWQEGRVTPLAESSAPAAITALFGDREGNLWRGTLDGLTRLRPQAFVCYSTAEGLVSERAWTIFEDSRGDLWIGTDGGVNRRRDGRFTTFLKRDGLAGNAVVSIAEDREGRLWFASTEGLSSFHDGRFTVYFKADGLLDNNVRSVHVDREGRLWVGTVGGLHRYENGAFQPFTTADGLASDHVLFVFEDRDGGLWVGSPNGLTRLLGGRCTVYRKEDGLSSNIVIAAHQDAEGTLWFGTIGGGVVRFREGRFAPVTTSAGLLSDTVTRILEDDYGDLWMGSLRGVFRVSRAALNGVADGRMRSLTCVAYGKADGLSSIDCSGGTQPAGWRMRDGRLWFPTARGVAVVDPRRLWRNRLAPPVYIERLVVDNREVARGEDLELAAGSRAVEFHFAALSFVDPSKVRFKYKLEGFDPDWVDAGARREAFYTNLPPGAYRFRVIAANDDGVWNEQGDALAFRLRPYFYQTGWFYLLCAAGAAVLAWSVYRLRLRQLRREFAAVLAERNRIARELHDTLAQGFTSVSMQLEAVNAKLQTSPEAAREHLNQARLLVRGSLAEAQRTVRDLRSGLLEDGDLAAALDKIARQLTAGTGVAAEVGVTGTPRHLPAQVESHLLRVGQEALTNAVRHAQASRVRIHLKYGERHVCLDVADDGRGFDAAAAGGGFGLRGMRERLAQLGGRLRIDSRPGAGTEISATIPVDETKGS